MKSPRTFTVIGTVFAAAMSATALTPITAGAADAVLSGTIKSADGATLGGVAVSARNRYFNRSDSWKNCHPLPVTCCPPCSYGECGQCAVK